MDTPQSLPSEDNATNPTPLAQNAPTHSGPTPSINSMLTSDVGHGPRAGSVVRGDDESPGLSRPSTDGVSRPSTDGVSRPSTAGVSRPPSAAFVPRPGSPTSPRSRQQLHLSVDAARMSPTLSNFQQSASSTHAGGIQPSASFFRPSRPGQPSQIFRPSSAVSGVSPQASPSQPEGDTFPLTPLSQQQSNNSSEELSDNVGATPDHLPPQIPSPQQRNFASQKRIRQSREPLLPIGSRGPSSVATGSSRGPPITRGILERSVNVNTNPISTAGATRRLRSSIDKFRRTLSFESSRRSTSTRPNISIDEDPALDLDENKVFDEERGFRTGTTEGTFPDTIPDPRSLASPPLPIPFDSNPPDRYPPLRALPRLHPTSGKSLRKYQLHRSRNKFFFGGRLLTGGDSPWAFIASLIVTFAITGIWFGTTCVWWWENESIVVAIVGAYMCLLTLSSMFATVSV
jgi:palmitoyltransferase ZDHHC9/14/18